MKRSVTARFFNKDGLLGARQYSYTIDDATLECVQDSEDKIFYIQAGKGVSKAQVIGIEDNYSGSYPYEQLKPFVIVDKEEEA